MLSPKAQEMLDLLVDAAHAYVDQRGFNVQPTQVSLFIPQTALAQVLGVHRMSIPRWFSKYEDLRKRIGFKRHYTSIKTADGGTRTIMDGTVFTIRLMGPGTTDVKVPIEDLRHAWRDMQSDIASGNTTTAKQGLYQSLHQELTEWASKIEYIIRWSIRSLNMNSVKDCSRVPDAFASEEPSAIANALVIAFQDHHSRRFWYKQASIWLRRGRVSTLRAQVERVLVDYGEGSVRNPAALLVHRLSAPRREQQTLFSG